MNYLTHYNNLINRAKGRSIDGYCESHHIIPRCMGGTDAADNLVNLTPEEHYLAHQLLMKIYPENHKLVYAASMMCSASRTHAGKRVNNKLYGWIKKRLAISASINGKGEKGSQFGTCWIHSVEKKISRKIPKTEIENYISSGWILGRVLNFDKPAKIDKRELRKQQTDIRYLDALQKSSSISEALRLLGLKTSGAGYSRMKSVIVKNKLEHKFAHEYIVW